MTRKTLLPGSHVVIVTRTADDLQGRFQELELRDTILIACPKGALFALVFRVSIQESTVAAQVLKTGTGGIWIDGCRVPTSGEDALSMERCNTPQSGRMYASVSPIGTFIRSNSSGALDTRKGRWPPNLLLVHHRSCVQEGSRQVKTGTAHGANASAGKVYGGGKGLISQAKGNTLMGYANESGLETIPAWICHPTCPVSLLDAQGVERGAHSPGSATDYSNQTVEPGYNKRWGQEVFGGMRHGDSGGVSRFYPQFQSLPEALDWISRLVNGPM